MCKGGGGNPSTPDGGGTFFRCSLNGQFAKLRDFDHGIKNQDVFPVALVQGSGGNFHGLSRDGGKTSLNANGPQQQFGNLVEVTKGVFFGVTAGGSAGVGTIIKETVSPAIVSPQTATAKVEMPFSYQIKATNGATSYGVLGLPQGLTVDNKTGLITGEIATAGARNMTLKATNAGGNGTAPLKLTVTN